MSFALPDHEIGAEDAVQSAFDAFPDGMAVIDHDGRFVSVNVAWCRLLGTTRDEVLGVAADRRLADTLGPEVAAAVRRGLLSRQPQRVVAALAGVALAPRFETRCHPMEAGPGAGPGGVLLVSRELAPVDDPGRPDAGSDRWPQQLWQAHDDGVLVVDAVDVDHPVRFVNAAALRLWGLPAEVAHTLTWRQFVHHTEASVDAGLSSRTDWLAALAAGDATELDVTLRNGRQLHCRRDAGDARTGPVRLWTFRELDAARADRQRLELELRSARSMLEAFSGLVAVLDDDLVYLFVNQCLARLMDRPAEQIVGRSVEQLLGADASRALRQHVQRALTDGQSVYEREFGATTMQVTLTPGRDARTGRIIIHAFGVDISPIKRAKQAVELARDEAEQANRAKSQFLSHMSHELRTPLNAVLGFAQLLQSDPENPPLPSQQRPLKEISNGARHLLTLINDVLDLGLIEAGRMAFDVRPLPLAPLVDECLQLVAPLAQQRGVKLRPPRAESLRRPVFADDRRIRQVLLNLLGNAIKFNHPGGEVRLSCQERRRTLRLSVRDTGPGLNPQQLGRLFTAFERVHDPNVYIEGTGIGLALCRRLMHGMGGEIGVESSVGAGSRFWIELPRSDEPGDTTVQAELELLHAVPDDVVRERRILYVEDNPVNVVLMQAMLARLPGVQMIACDNAREGLRLAREVQPHLILLDIQLPDVGGVELLRLLRQHPATAGIPAIAVSANAMDGDVAAGRAAGFIDYITKPVDMPRLISAVQAAFEPPRSRS